MFAVSVAESEETMIGEYETRILGIALTSYHRGLLCYQLLCRSLGVQITSIPTVDNSSPVEVE